MQTHALNALLTAPFPHDNTHPAGDQMNRLPSSFFLRLLSILIIPFTLVACTTATSVDERRTGIEAEYILYVKLVRDTASLKNLASHWSRSAREMFFGTLDNSGQPIALHNFQPVLKYPALFASPPAAPLSTSIGENGCLMIFGEASDSGMLAMHIKFTREDGRWLHDEVHAQYLDDGAESPDRPNCQFPSPPS